MQFYERMIYNLQYIVAIYYIVHYIFLIHWKSHAKYSDQMAK